MEILDVSLDEAENILTDAGAVVALRTKNLAEAEESGEGQAEGVETHAVSAEFDESVDAGEVEPSDEMTAEGYDEAVETGVPFTAEPEVQAKFSADPVALTEVEALTDDEVVLQEPGRDLRPDTITPAPDITSTGVAALDHLAQEETELIVQEAIQAAADETLPAPESSEAASDGSSDEEKQDASPDAAE